MLKYLLSILLFFIILGFSYYYFFYNKKIIETVVNVEENLEQPIIENKEEKEEEDKKEEFEINYFQGIEPFTFYMVLSGLFFYCGIAFFFDFFENGYKIIKTIFFHDSNENKKWRLLTNSLSFIALLFFSFLLEMIAYLLFIFIDTLDIKAEIKCDKGFFDLFKYNFFHPFMLKLNIKQLIPRKYVFLISKMIKVVFLFINFFFGAYFFQYDSSKFKIPNAGEGGGE